jgi:hypothetical protein
MRLNRPKIAVAALLLPAAAAAVYILVVLTLSAPFAASETSAYLTRLCGRPVTVVKLRLHGLSLSAEGITIAGDPSPGVPFLTLRSIGISPSVGDLVSGRIGLSSLSVTGLSADLHRRDDGTWNFQTLLDRLATKKKKGGSPVETRIRRLSCDDASVTVNGTRFGGISFSLRDFSTRAPSPSSFDIAFRDEDGNPARISGKAVAATRSFDVSLSAPRFSLRSISKKAEGNLGVALEARLKEGELHLGVEGNIATPVAAGSARIPVEAAFSIAGGGNLGRDEAWIDRATVTINSSLRLKGSARVNALRKERRYRADLDASCSDIAELLGRLPENLRHDLSVGGALAGRLRVEGDAAGPPRGDCEVVLNDGSVARAKTRLAGGISAKLSLHGGGNAWKGSASLSGNGSDGTSGHSEAKLSLLLSERFRPVAALLPSFKAVISGIPLEGSAAYRRGEGVPLTAEIRGDNIALPLLNRYLPPSKHAFSSGSGSFALRASGSSLRNLSGACSASVAGAGGTVAGKRIAAAKGAVDVKIAGMHPLAASGKVSLEGKVEGESSAASASFVLRDRLAILSGLSARAGAATAGFDSAEVSVTPEREGKAFTAAVHGLAARRGEMSLDGGEASFRGRVPGGSRLPEGEGSFSGGRISFRGAEASSISGKVTVASGRGDIRLTGRCIGGTLTAEGIGSFSPEQGGTVRVSLLSADAALLARTLPAAGLAPAGGSLDASVDGEFGRSRGFSCRFSLAGTDITVKNGARIAASGLAGSASGSWKGGTLFLERTQVTLAPRGVVTLSGKLERALAPDRRGDFTIEMGETAIPPLLAAVAGSLPLPLQEAETGGRCALSGRLSVRGKSVSAEGTASIGDAFFRIDSQKLSVTGISGRLPFSATIGGTPPTVRKSGQYARESHRRILAELRGRNGAAASVTIGRIAFGPVEIGETKLFLNAGEGLTRLDLLQSSLFGGGLLGEGYFYFDRRPVFGLDLVADGISLRKLCESIPAMKGYISGKVDGVVSLRSEKPGLEGLLGFVSLWTRESKEEKMLVSKEFLQKLAGKKLKGIFFRDDRPYDNGEITAFLEKGFLTFERLDIGHTNIFGVRDLNVSVAAVQNRIALEHLLGSIREAAARGKKIGAGGESPAPETPQTEFKWAE